MSHHENDRQRWSQVEQVLDLVLDLESSDRRVAMIHDACDGDADLEQEVLLYLQAAEANDLDQGAVAGAADFVNTLFPDTDDHTFAPGDRIGAYILEGIIGTGGMGTVYKARRADGQFELEVALKVISAASADETSRLRFLRERQILANLRHSHVAALLDGGVTEGGSPYLVLALIDGGPITSYCKQRELGREERIRLLLQACEGVQHVHGMGVIHRDLKPGNILVEENAEGVPTAFVLDFGIAMTSGDVGMTMTGEVIGTPGYMAPEQALGQRSLIDRRCDVFALGVMLYELLTESRPFPGKSPGEILLKITTGEPTPPRQVNPSIPPDLETIVLTCINHNLTGRYDSVRALIDDLGCYLDGRPIAARPVGHVSRLLRRAHRHPGVAALAVTAVAVLVISTMSLALGAVKYTRDLKQEKNREVAAREDAEVLLDFMLRDLYNGLQPLGRLDLLDQVARKSLAYFEARQVETLHGESLHRRSEALYNLGAVLESQGRDIQAMLAYDQSRNALEELSQEADTKPAWKLDLVRSLTAVAQGQVNRGDPVTARGYVLRALEMSRKVASTTPTGIDWQARHFQTLADCGWILRETGDLDGAATVISEAVSFARTLAGDDPRPPAWLHREAVAHSYLGLVLQQQSRFSDAVAAFSAGHTLCRELAAKEPDNATWLEELQLVAGRLGLAMADGGHAQAALGPLDEAVTVAHHLADLEPDNARWKRELNVGYASLASVERELGKLDAALANTKRALDISRIRAAETQNDPSAQNDFAWDLLEEGRILRDLGRSAEAREAFRTANEVLAPVTDVVDEPYYLDTRVQALLELDQVEQAGPLIERLLASGWSSPDFLALCRDHGLLLDVPIPAPR